MTGVAWWNGRLVPLAEATTGVAAFGLHYGVGVFEGIRCYARRDGRSAIFRLREHIARLYDSAKTCAFEIPFPRETLEAACGDVMRANGLAEAYIRPVAFTGGSTLGLGAQSNPIDVAVICWSWSNILGPDSLTKGIRVQTSSFVRGHMNATMSKAKITGQYVGSVLAKRESQRLGFDDALMLDADGRVCEASAANLFVVYDGQLWTPPLDLPILAGITRDSILTLARDRGLPIVERAMTRDMLYAASEVFLTGTGAEVCPVREVDGRVIGTGERGPLTARLQDAFFEVVRGPGEPRPDWLTFI